MTLLACTQITNIHHPVCGKAVPDTPPERISPRECVSVRLRRPLFRRRPAHHFRRRLFLSRVSQDGDDSHDDEGERDGAADSHVYGRLLHRRVIVVVTVDATVGIWHLGEILVAMMINNVRQLFVPEMTKSLFCRNWRQYCTQDCGISSLEN